MKFDENDNAHEKMSCNVECIIIAIYGDRCSVVSENSPRLYFRFALLIVSREVQLIVVGVADSGRC